MTPNCYRLCQRSITQRHAMQASSKLQRRVAQWSSAPAIDNRARQSTVAMASGNGTGQAKNVLGGELQCCCKDPVTVQTKTSYSAMRNCSPIQL